MHITKPHLHDAPTYFHYYISLIEESDLLEALTNSTNEALTLFQSISAEQGNYRYATGKWSVKEVLQHCIDSERIFAYRALRFSRRDATPLPGFDENAYAPNANCEGRSLKSLSNEFVAVRNATSTLYEYMNEEMLDFKSIANDVSNSARAMGWMIVGHTKHHLGIVKERYLIL